MVGAFWGQFYMFWGEMLYKCMSVGNIRYMIQSQRGEPVFGLPNLGNLLTRPYMGGPDYKWPCISTLRSKIHCIYLHTVIHHSPGHPTHWAIDPYPLVYILKKI